MSQSRWELRSLSKHADSLSLLNFEKCQTLCRQGQTMSIQAHDSAYFAYFKALEAKAHYFHGSYDSAAFLFSQAFFTLDRIKDLEKLAFVSNEYAKLCRKVRKDDKALELYNKAMSAYVSLGDIHGQSMIWNESGVVYENQGNYNKAITYYQQSLQLARQINDSVGVAYALNFLGTASNLNKDYAKAIDYMEQSMAKFSSLKDVFAVASTYLDIAKIHADGSQYSLAKIAADSCLYMAEKLKSKDLQKEALAMQSEIAEAQGQHALALQYLKQHDAIKDSIYTAAAQKQIEELNLKYNVQKIENEKEVLRFKVQRRNATLAVLLVLIFLGAGLLLMWKRKRDWQQAHRLQQEIIKQQDIATKAVIEAEEKERNRIAADLHDGVGQLITAAKFNLNGIAADLDLSMPQKNIFDKAIALVEQSGKEIRSVSHNIMPNVLLRSGLGAAVKSFLDKIESKELKVNLFTSGLNDKIDSNIEIVLYRVIQECVNNVIKHAHASLLDISMYNEAKGISISIEDNGLGFDKDKLKYNEGIGVKNIETRVKYLKGEIEIETSKNRGTFISIFIPKFDAA